MKRRLIALVGHAGAGKDTVAGMMFPCQTFAFAEPLKRFCQEVFAFNHDQVWGSSEHRNAPDVRYTRADGYPLTPRHAMQTLGTEWGRAMHPNIWAEYGVRRAVDWLKENRWAYPDGTSLTPSLAVITDCRFVNEAYQVKKAGGEVWRVLRAGHVLPPEVANHPSETEQDSPAMKDLIDLVIYNGGTLDDLKCTVRAAVGDFLAK